MNIESMNGLISAIEQESIQPSPSHANLARLMVKALKEIIAGIPEVMAKQIENSTQTESTVGATVDLSAPESKEQKKRARFRK